MSLSGIIDLERQLGPYPAPGQTLKNCTFTVTIQSGDHRLVGPNGSKMAAIFRTLGKIVALTGSRPEAEKLIEELAVVLDTPAPLPEPAINKPVGVERIEEVPEELKPLAKKKKRKKKV